MASCPAVTSVPRWTPSADTRARPSRTSTRVVAVATSSRMVPSPLTSAWGELTTSAGPAPRAGGNVAVAFP